MPLRALCASFTLYSIATGQAVTGCAKQKEMKGGFRRLRKGEFSLEKVFVRRVDSDHRTSTTRETLVCQGWSASSGLARRFCQVTRWLRRTQRQNPASAARLEFTKK